MVSRCYDSYIIIMNIDVKQTQVKYNMLYVSAEMCSERDSPLEPFVLPAPGLPELARLTCGAHLGRPNHNAASHYVVFAILPIACLQMPWGHQEPGHQQACYWSNEPEYCKPNA